jgi:membrane-bound ClpP family serine protease
MEIEPTVPALLFPAIAILMLGYINRYLGAANVVRNFVKDYDTGYKHAHVIEQLNIMRHRLMLFRLMTGTASMALLLACLSMFLIFAEHNDAGTIAFGASLIAMILSIMFALTETALSNRSLNIEIQDVLTKESGTKRRTK